MTLPVLRVTLLAASLSASTLAGQATVGVIRSRPVPLPQVIGDLESRVLQNPEDIDTRMQLLQFYWDTAPAGKVDPSRGSARLRHILYLVERHPELAASASKLAYVYRINGPYANVADHEAVRGQWLAAVQGNPRDNAIAINAARFLEVEDPDDAERVLARALETDPENRELAANLGFLYAMQLLGLDSMAPGARPVVIGRDHPQHAMAELERSNNAVVLAAAGTALPNLSKGVGGLDSINQTMFDFASELSARARRLAPDDRDIQGPMPLIEYFVAAQKASGVPPFASSPPGRIRVGGNVQASNLVRKTEPQYPDAARKAGIEGEVRMTVIVGRDGIVQNVQLINGHPLLADAAIQAVETWLYRPTLLNGAPVEVETTVTVSFPPN
jgi:TonB family protein